MAGRPSGHTGPERKSDDVCEGLQKKMSKLDFNDIGQARPCTGCLGMSKNTYFCDNLGNNVHLHNVSHLMKFVCMVDIKIICIYFLHFIFIPQEPSQ